MAIIFADFPSGQEGLYGTTAAFMLNGIWAQLLAETTVGTTDITADPDPSIGSDGNVFRTQARGNGTGRNGARFALPSPQATEGFGVRLWLNQLPVNNTNTPFISFNTEGNVTLVAIRILSNGAIEARTTFSGGGTQFGVTDGPVVTANSSPHIESKVFADPTTGTIEVRVNGVTVLDLDGLNTGTGPIGQIIVGCYAASDSVTQMNASWKDMVFWDTTGAEGNDFQGSVAVRDLLTDADIALNWATSSGSTGWNLLDESPPVDTGYIQAGDPPPDPAKFSLTDLPDDVTSVRALIPIVRAVKTDGGDCNIQVGLTPNDANWDDGADRPITTAYTYWWDVSHLSPATSAPWTPVEVNAAYVRVDRTL